METTIAMLAVIIVGVKEYRVLKKNVFNVGRSSEVRAIFLSQLIQGSSS
jgi:hypothetical protein